AGRGVDVEGAGEEEVGGGGARGAAETGGDVPWDLGGGAERAQAGVEQPIGGEVVGGGGIGGERGKMKTIGERLVEEPGSVVGDAHVGGADITVGGIDDA